MPDDRGYTLVDAKIRLLVRNADLPSTAREVAGLLAQTGKYFARGGPVRIVPDAQGGFNPEPFRVETVVNAAHNIVQPYVVRRRNKRAEEEDITLPDRVARLYLAMTDAWSLPPLRGIAYAPILATDGTTLTTEGYDPATGLWCGAVPDLSGLLPERPSRKQAARALVTLRKMFSTFPFADAARIRGADGIERVDLTQPPKLDESGLLVGVLTAVCRPSLNLAPGLLLHAPSLTGSGSGKGLLVRGLCALAFGQPPHAFTGGADRAELEKSLSAVFMQAVPVVFLDNLNGVALRSDLLASALSEPVVGVRILGHSEMARVNANAFVVVTGNGLTLSEDLVRRFVTVELDARTEDPDARKFTGDFVADCSQRRAELLAAAVTIWRWGRLNSGRLKRGTPLGGYTDWCDWVRDPLVALGCADPVARVAENKAADPRRQEAANLLQTWHECHGSKAVLQRDLDKRVIDLLDPHGRGRQFVATRLAGMDGIRIAGFTLSRHKSDAKWSHATYAVVPIDGEVQSPLPL
jgi:hypothetical protein